ncbi:MAG: flagellar biosynthesis protein FliQ [Gemmatimonadota bacterium]|nr:flagellar biosynthesis protein FliQ [Gemmatimonadota bacterium]
MTPSLAIDLARDAVLQALLVAAPMLLVAVGVSLAVSVFQAVTQIQDQTLSFVPKLLAAVGTLIVGLSWMLQTLVNYTAELFRSIPNLG